MRREFCRRELTAGRRHKGSRGPDAHITGRQAA